MTKVVVHRTYPCGFQESVSVEGFPNFKEDNEPRGCRLHGLNCQRQTRSDRP